MIGSRSLPDPSPVSLLNESLEDLYEKAPCGYLTTAVNGRILKANTTLATWLGHESPNVLVGKRFVDLLAVGGKMFYETHVSPLLGMQPAVEEIALDMIGRNERILPVLINGRQQRSEAGEPLFNRFTIFNASQRRMYERQLLAARDLFKTTLSSIGDGVISTDADQNITFMNPVAEELSGWKEDEAQGKPIREVVLLVREDDENHVANPLTVAIRDGIVVELANHTVLIAKDGRRIPVDDSASPVRDGAGDIVGGVLIFRDISARRKDEKALRDAHERLEISAAELRRSNEDLSQFAHVASHDLRSPLRTVITFSQVLEKRYAEQIGDGQKLLDGVTKAAKQMSRLIEDLLLYASVSNFDPTRVRQLANANVEIASAIENLRTGIEETGASVRFDVLPSVPAEGSSLVQLFQNLIGNAIHYRSGLPPQIHVSAAEENDEWLFSCADNGIGIDSEHQAKIFEPFQRLHGSERPGTGIGLAVCKRIVERYGGRIWVVSEERKGSTFFFTLPKRSSPSEMP